MLSLGAAAFVLGGAPDPDSEAMSRVAMFLRRLAGEEVGGG